MQIAHLYLWQHQLDVLFNLALTSFMLSLDRGGLVGQTLFKYTQGTYWITNKVWLRLLCVNSAVKYPALLSYTSTHCAGKAQSPWPCALMLHVYRLPVRWRVCLNQRPCFDTAWKATVVAGEVNEDQGMEVFQRTFSCVSSCIVSHQHMMMYEISNAPYRGDQLFFFWCNKSACHGICY